MLLKLSRLNLGCAIKCLSVRSFYGNCSLPEFNKAFLLGLIAFPKILADLFLCPKRHFYLSENKRR